MSAIAYRLEPNASPSPSPRQRPLALAISAVLAGGLWLNTAAAQAFPATINLSTLDGTIGFRLDGVASPDRSGYSVSSAGDINGDGVDDVIVGAFGADPNGIYSGSSYVVFGRDAAAAGPFNPVLALSTLDGSNGFRIDGVASFDFSGGSVSAAGDVNGDGVDDVVIGANGAPNGNQSGSSYVVFGRDAAVAGTFDPVLALSALDGSNGFRIDGVALDDLSGISVSAAGDVNGDGVDDVIIGASDAEPNGTYSGSSYVVFGRDTAAAGPFDPVLDLSALDGSNGFRIDGVASGDFSGRSVSAAGDVNGDGVDDVIVGAYRAEPNGSDSGSSYVVFGRDAAVGGFAAILDLSALDGSNGFRIDGVVAGDNSGTSVSAAGDVNGDGVDDVIVGAYRAEPNGSDSGSSYVVFGRDAAAGGFAAVLDLSALDGGNGFRLDGVALSDQSGRSVSAAGDVNGDGVGDVIVGAYGASPNGNLSGSSYVVFGGSDGPGSGRIEVQADQASVDLGAIPLGSPVTTTVTLINQASTSPQLGTLSAAGSSAISIANDACSGQPLGTAVGTNDRCTFDIEVNLNDPGPISGQIIAPYNSSLGPEIVLVSAFPDGLFIDSFEN